MITRAIATNPSYNYSPPRWRMPTNEGAAKLTFRTFRTYDREKTIVRGGTGPKYPTASWNAGVRWNMPLTSFVREMAVGVTDR
eukprot:3397735-Pyramimonas_sp.AAC.1